MKISELENQILQYSSKYKIEYAKKNINNKTIDLSINKNGKEFDVYGKFKEDKTRVMTCHIKINTLSGITYSKCSCSLHREGLKNIRNIYLCEHLTLAAYKFLDRLKDKIRLSRKINNKNNFLEFAIGEKKKKTSLNVNYVLKPVKRHERDYYMISLHLENNQKKYFPKDLKQFLKCFYLNENYIFNNDFEYTSSLYYFDESNKNALEYLYEKVLDNQINDNHIIIDSLFIGKFLKLLTGKRVKIYIDSIPYICSIHNEKIPLSFTVKERSENYILTTQKILPLNLNIKYDVYFYNKSLYICDTDLNNKYKILFKEFAVNKNIVIDKKETFIRIKKLIDLLYKLGKTVTLDEGIIKRISKESNVELLFYREDSDYLCNPIIISGEEKYTYNEVLDEDNYKNIIQKVENILNKNRFYYIKDKFKFLGNNDEFYMFLKDGIKELKKNSSVIFDKNNEFYKFKDISLNLITIEENKFKINGFNMDEFNKIMNSYNNGKDFIKAADGRFIDLTDEKCVKLLDSINIIKPYSEVNTSKMLYLYEKTKNESDYLNLKENIKDYLCSNNYINDEMIISEDLNNKLKEYQKEGVRWFRKLSSMKLGGILSDEMGLGKTIQTIAFLCSEPLKKSLIVMPASLIYNWKSEINKFAPQLKVGTAYGKLEDRIKVIEEYKEYNIIITSYNTLNNDIEKYEDHHFNYIILY